MQFLVFSSLLLASGINTVLANPTIQPVRNTLEQRLHARDFTRATSTHNTAYEPRKIKRDVSLPEIHVYNPNGGKIKLDRGSGGQINKSGEKNVKIGGQKSATATEKNRLQVPSRGPSGRGKKIKTERAKPPPKKEVVSGTKKPRGIGEASKTQLGSTSGSGPAANTDSASNSAAKTGNGAEEKNPSTVIPSTGNATGGKSVKTDRSKLPTKGNTAASKPETRKKL